jgi:hypothetical protein
MTEFTNLPDTDYKARDLFGIDTDLVVKGYKDRTDHVPPIDPDYLFDRNTTLAILAGFAYNRRVMVQGYHGTGTPSSSRTASRSPNSATASCPGPCRTISRSSSTNTTPAARTLCS